MLRRITILVVLALSFASAVAQNDSILVVGRDTIVYRYTPTQNRTSKNRGERILRYLEESNTDRSLEKPIDFSFVPGLYYTQSTSFGLALMATGLYRLDKQNRELSPSDVNIFASASITGFYRVGIKGTNIFRNDRQRILYNAEFYSQPTRFWGVGYNAAMENGALLYLASRCMVEGRFLQRVVKGLYVGIGADYNYHFGTFGGRRYASEEAFLSRLGGDGVAYSAAGISLFVEYDRRDLISNPTRGVYLAVQAKVRPQAMNNVGKTLWSGRIVADYYQRLWRGAVIAFDLRGEFNSLGTPWVYNATIGGFSAMRGYYLGRFNDLCAVTLQAELRQKIYKRLGAVAWGGAGNVFHTFDTFDITHTLPTYGIGLRYEVKKGVNFRLDYGFGGRDSRGRIIHGAIFSLSEAF